MECLGCEIERIKQMIRHTVWSADAKGLVVGISGGLDSAVAAGLCAGAIGGEHVLGLLLPSEVTSDEDLADGEAVCRKFGIPCEVVSIAPLLCTFVEIIPDYEDNAYLSGNLMARLRMATLYYFANQRNALVCGTSNRSEYLLGYSTKYGDSAADLQPILHLYKTTVSELAGSLGVPESVIRKAPSAGLFPGQSDEADLGYAYSELDAALRSLEANDWKAESETETAVLEKVRKSAHKRMPQPNLL